MKQDQQLCKYKQYFLKFTMPFVEQMGRRSSSRYLIIEIMFIK